MQFVMLFIDIKALICFSIIYFFSFLLYSYNKKYSTLDRTIHIGRLTFTLCIIVSVSFMVYLIAITDTQDQIGPPLAFSLLLILYGSILYCLSQIISLIKHRGIDENQT